GDGARPFAVHAPPQHLSGDLFEEHFGPATVICRAPTRDFEAIMDKVPGNLVATVIAADSDADAAAALLPGLARGAGRVVWNGVPTGVAVCDAMHHGGPWPASSTPGFTSVGTAAVQRFLRPVALQGVPDSIAAAVFAE
ncbi:MAG: aldehyde dehydrogenase family protein, partial [Stackebrandtia sp.]